MNTDDSRPCFGNRCLTDTSDPFSQNAWDNVEWTAEMEQSAKEAVEAQELAAEDVREKCLSDMERKWDSFYTVHENKFFKDRHWLLTEFQELLPDEAVHSRENPLQVLEIGCGVGNTVIPLLKLRREDMFIHACDYSKTAVGTLQQQPEFDPARCNAFVADVSQADVDLPIQTESIDRIVMIFVLSAIDPSKFQTVISNLLRYLKPGGLLLLRDYGRHDMAQLRFKAGRRLSDNFYTRGDGTCVYFFAEDEIHELLSHAGLERKLNYVDRRLLVNRGRQLKMFRVWIHCKYMKPLLPL